MICDSGQFFMIFCRALKLVEKQARRGDRLSTLRISLIAALAENRVIGRGGALPWRVEQDLQRFKKITWGHSLIMGRRSFQSIGSPLPGRRNLVLSRQSLPPYEGIELLPSLEAALSLLSESQEVFIIGGASLYQEALSRAQRLCLSLIHANPQGDRFFPPFDESRWSLAQRIYCPAGPRDEHSHSYFELLPKSPDRQPLQVPFPEIYSRSEELR